MRKMAERAGFEPAIAEAIHALQACLIGRSSTSPCKLYDGQKLLYQIHGSNGINDLIIRIFVEPNNDRVKDAGTFNS